MQQLDHATIFVMIAGSYTPLCLVAIQGWVAPVHARGRLGGRDGRRRARLQRRAAEPHRPGRALHRARLGLGRRRAAAASDHLTAGQLVLIAVGGVLYTVGAIFLATNWPDPFPRVFGYHEVWHVLVVAAVVCHFVAISSRGRTPALA